jgi:hypothetical protein
MSRPLLAPSPEVLEQADALRARGYSWATIASALHFPAPVLRRALNRELRAAERRAGP